MFASVENWQAEVNISMTNRKSSQTPDHFATYRVKVRGSLAPDWMRIYQGISADFDGEITTLDGIIADQSALRGLLCCLWDLNLTILSVVLIHSKKNSKTGCLKERE